MLKNILFQTIFLSVFNAIVFYSKTEHNFVWLSLILFYTIYFSFSRIKSIDLKQTMFFFSLSILGWYINTYFFCLIPATWVYQKLISMEKGKEKAYVFLSIMNIFTLFCFITFYGNQTVTEALMLPITSTIQMFLKTKFLEKEKTTE